MSSRILVNITLVVVCFALLVFYMGWNGWMFLSGALHFHYPGLYWTVFSLLSLSYLFSRFASRILPDAAAQVLNVLGAYWMAVMLYLVVLLPFADLAALVLGWTGLFTPKTVDVLGSAVILVMIVIFIRGTWNARKPVVRRYEIAIPKRAGSLRQLRVAMVSDLHLGTLVRNRYLQTMVKSVNALQPDLILLPGDIIDEEIEPFIRQNMAETLRGLRAPLGIFASLGNHEYYGGHIRALEEQLKGAGIELLMDRVVRVADSLYIIGRKDKTAERMDPEKRLKLEQLTEPLDKSLPLLVLDHQPDRLGEAEQAGVDLQVSGHTHRGQMAPNHWITKKMYELDWGYLQKGQLHAIVSSGYGTWGPPIRIGSRSEIVEIVISFG